MRVLKVVAEGQITSFRYPHFMQQIHPTYWMPPPSTIYGHISSALGEWFNPTGVSFAYQFTYEAKVNDVEHVIVLSPTGERSKLPGTDITKVLEGNVNPFDRELLFRPRLVLYVNQPEWIDAFRSPRYAVVLGRSQDLFTYTRIDVVDLEQADRAYFEHTLAPHEMALQFGRGISVLMPRYVDNERNRAPTFQQYVMLQNRVHLPDPDRLQFSNVSYGPYWIDPSSAVDKGSHLGLPFLTFVDEVEP